MPRATINIGEPEGQAAMSSVWRYAVGYIPGEENGGLVSEATGGSPARLADYDDSGWEICHDLPGGVSGGFTFAWYRTTITIPDTVAGQPTNGMRVQFETCVDDYGEIWIDGECNRDRGVVQGFNVSHAHAGNHRRPAGKPAHHRRPGRQRAVGRPLRHRVHPLRPARL